MPKELVLVAEDQDDIRILLVETLEDAGYEVLQASDGGAALEQATRERPDVLLLDVWMPVMDGFEVLRKLREDPATQKLPVVMLTALSAEEGEKRGMDLGVTHYLTKPLNHGALEATLRVVLRESALWAGNAGDGQAAAAAGDVSLQSRDTKIFTNASKGAVQRSGRKKATQEEQKDLPVIRTADKLIALEQKLGGGVPLNSITLMEGAASSGKSVLCQHLAFGALEGGYETAYFSSEHSKESLVTQMKSLNLDISGHLRNNRFHVFGVPEPKEGESAEPLLAGLSQTIENLPVRCKFVVVDSITDLAGSSPESAVIAFFTSCRRICNKGRTVLVSIHTYAFGAEMFTRLRSLCDNYFFMRSETMGGKAMKTVEVRKVNSNNVENNNMISFEVVANMGMKVLPISRAKA
jgi:flagellar protein FlaH